MNTFDKIAFYHDKDDKGASATFAYKTSDSVKQIKHDMRANNCVLDAIYYVESEKVTLYTRNLRKADVYGNVYGL